MSTSAPLARAFIGLLHREESIALSNKDVDNDPADTHIEILRKRLTALAYHRQKNYHIRMVLEYIRRSMIRIIKASVSVLLTLASIGSP